MLVPSMTHAEVYAELERDRETATVWWRHHLDYNCVKMSAINMAIHGCFGECVCHDTLCEPGTVRLGYIVNEMMWPFPTDIPSIRRYNDPRRFVCTRLWQQRKQQHEKEQSQESGVSDFTPETPLSDPVQAEKPKQPQQLTLW